MSIHRKTTPHMRTGAVKVAAGDRLRAGEDGGREGIRTLDLSVANAALSQLSYAPKF